MPAYGGVQELGLLQAPEVRNSTALAACKECAVQHQCGEPVRAGAAASRQEKLGLQHCLATHNTSLC